MWKLLFKRRRTRSGQYGGCDGRGGVGVAVSADAVAEAGQRGGQGGAEFEKNDWVSVVQEGVVLFMRRRTRSGQNSVVERIVVILVRVGRWMLCVKEDEEQNYASVLG